MMAQQLLISIVGPTAIGKTTFAIAIAKHFKTQIISADSRQFYKEMQIGTAVPSEEELAQVPHHFIQHKSIHDSYTVGDFEKEALSVLNRLFRENDIVVMVGGSGLYTDAVTSGLDHFPEVAPEIREDLNQLHKDEGLDVLQARLQKLDPDYFEKVDLQNPHRLIRALEICIATNKPYSSFLNQPRASRPFDCLTVGISAEREIIYKRINDRVDQMMEKGMLEEVTSLHKYKSRNALQTVGYKELFQFLEGKVSLEFALEEIKMNSRRFAKRQLTWFKKNNETLWVDYSEQPLAVISKVQERLLKSHGK